MNLSCSTAKPQLKTYANLWKRNVLDKINDSLAIQAVAYDVPLTVLSHEVIIGSLRLHSAKSTEDVTDAFLQTQARQLINDNFVLLRSQVPTKSVLGAAEVSKNPVRRGGYLGLLEQADRCSGVQGNGIPNQLQPVRVPLFTSGFPLEEISRSIGTVDLKAFILTDELSCRIPAQIMEDRSNRVNFKVAALLMLPESAFSSSGERFATRHVS